MIDPLEPIIFDPSTSCTKDEAVAKMLGWMKGHIRKALINVTEYGIPESELPFLPKLEGSVSDHLQELHEASRRRLIAALESSEPPEVLESCLEEEARYRNLMANATQYALAIEQEFAKGALSAFSKPGQSATEGAGDSCINLLLLD